MTRHRSLAGTWQFQVDPDGTITVDTLAPDREITVPMPWQAVFPELQTYSGYAWYRLDVDIQEDWLGGALLLRFGAVDYWCQVFVNGELAGEHEGGYMPIVLAIQDFARPGRNEIAVRVYDCAQEEISVPRWPNFAESPRQSRPPFDPNDIPHGKQEWYINAGGIWQDVTLTAVPSTYIDHVLVTPNIHTGRAHLRVELGGAEVEGGELFLRLEGEGAPGEARVGLEPGQSVYEVEAQVERPHLWNMDDPYLYRVHCRLRAGGEESSTSTRFGFREVSTRDGLITINGEPIYLLSALDQDLYPDTIYTVPSEEYLRDQFRKAKELGFNNLRCHIKPPDPVYLDIADEMGMLIWTEVPSWRTFYLKGTMHANQLNLSETVQGRVEQLLEEMVRRDYNHPSIIIWTIVNEDWGTTLPLSHSDRSWVSRMYDFCKRLDPTRLVVDNSACPHSWGPNIHVKSDLDDFHIYANIPDQSRGFENALDQYNLRPLWTYSSHGDSDRRGFEPLVLSEFGNWGLPSMRRLREQNGGEQPHWFGIGPWWNSWEGEAGWPDGVEERYRRLGLEGVWGDYEAFAESTQWHQFSALKFEIETIRRQPHLAGYVITELADIYWESNGLLDFYRNPKVYHDIFGRINTPDMVIPQADRYAYWDEEQAVARLHLAHFARPTWSGARLRWSLPGSEASRDIPRVRRGSVLSLETQRWDLPRVEGTQTVPIEFVVLSAEEQELARNSLDLMVVSSALRQVTSDEVVAVLTRDVVAAESTEVLARPPEGIDWAQPADAVQVDLAAQPPETDLAGVVRSLGYRTTRRLTPETRVVVTDFPDTALLRWVREGGDMLFTTSGPSPFFWVQGRSGAYSGSWLTSFTWVRPEVHRRLRVANPLSMPYRNIMPHGTILGLPMEDRAVQGDFLAGMVSGWVGHPAVNTVQFRYGRGRVIMTTFALSGSLHFDPVAVCMFHDLIEHLRSEACEPVLRANW